MDTKTRKKMKAEFYKPWVKVMHITKFGKNLRKHQEYLQTCDIRIDNETKTQFYLEQMIDSTMFEKRKITEWENANHKCYKKATEFFRNK